MEENEENILIFGGRDDDLCEDILLLNIKDKIWKRKKYNGYFDSV
jgi:Galactose oxidase, central domain